MAEGYIWWGTEQDRRVKVGVALIVLTSIGAGGILGFALAVGLIRRGFM